MEAERLYRELAARKAGEERDILTALADAEGRHEAHWLELLGGEPQRLPRASVRTRMLAAMARRFGSIFVLALAQNAENRSPYDDDPHATPAMRADEKIHGEVVRVHDPLRNGDTEVEVVNPVFVDPEGARLHA